MRSNGHRGAARGHLHHKAPKTTSSAACFYGRREASATRQRCTIKPVAAASAVDRLEKAATSRWPTACWLPIVLRRFDNALRRHEQPVSSCPLAAQQHCLSSLGWATGLRHDVAPRKPRGDHVGASTQAEQSRSQQQATSFHGAAVGYEMDHADASLRKAYTSGEPQAHSGR